MSKYTISLKTVCEAYAGVASPAVWASPREIMEKAAPRVFDFEWPIFDEEYREHLEVMILRRYYTRELCCMEVGRWKMWLEERLNEIMPMYNRLYETELLEFNPLYDVDLTTTRARDVDQSGNTSADETSKGKVTNESSSESTATGSQVTDSTTAGTTNTDTSGSSTRTDNLTKMDSFSDTPQGSLVNVENGTYLTNARKVNDTGTVGTQESGSEDITSNVDVDATVTTNDSTNASMSGTSNTEGSKQKTGTSKAKTVEEYLETVRGKRGGTSYAKMISDYRATFMNIDKMVLDELEDLFFGLW